MKVAPWPNTLATLALPPWASATCLTSAKFITGAMQVLRRVGADSADAAKRANELRDMMEKTTTLVRTIVKEMPEAERQPLLDRFLAPTQDSLGEFALLLGELTRVKNYMLDQR